MCAKQPVPSKVYPTQPISSEVIHEQSVPSKCAINITVIIKTLEQSRVKAVLLNM